MKKTTKGAIAAASAALLLAGGAGTMAAWSTSTTAGVGATITAGNMTVAQNGTGTWTWGSGTGASSGTEFFPATDRIVPGDTVNYTAKYDINLVGKNLKATLTPTLGGTTGPLFDAQVLTVAPAAGTPTEYTAGTQTVTYVSSITFNPGTTGLVGATLGASVAGGVVTLQQIIN